MWPVWYKTNCKGKRSTSPSWGCPIFHESHNLSALRSKDNCVFLNVFLLFVILSLPPPPSSSLPPPSLLLPLPFSPHLFLPLYFSSFSFLSFLFLFLIPFFLLLPLFLLFFFFFLFLLFILSPYSLPT